MIDPECFHFLHPTDSGSIFSSHILDQVELDPGRLNALRNRSFEITDEATLLQLAELNVAAPDDSRIVEQDDVLRVAYAITYACNMDCSYCLQPKSCKNSEVDSADVVSWLTKMLRFSQFTRLEITFFGGEPFLRVNKLFRIVTGIKTLCDSLHISFSFDIVTNGTRLQLKEITPLKLLGLKSLHITMDGFDRQHDSRRPFETGNGTFFRIYSNILSVADVMDIYLTTNISDDAESYEDYLSFLHLHHEAMNVKGIRFTPYFEKHSRNSYFFAKKHFDNLIRLWDLADEFDIPVQKDFIIGSDGFFNDSSLALSPEGRVYPCAPFLGIDDFCLGSITPDLSLANTYSLYDNFHEKCFICGYVGSCAGDCRFVSFQNSEKISEPASEEVLLDSVLTPV